jgi:hypothetical protein
MAMRPSSIELAPVKASEPENGVCSLPTPPKLAAFDSDPEASTTSPNTRASPFAPTALSTALASLPEGSLLLSAGCDTWDNLLCTPMVWSTKTDAGEGRCATGSVDGVLAMVG